MFVQDTPRLSLVFGELERRKEEMGLSDYSVSQCSLEQIFIQFAAEQEEEKGAVKGMVVAAGTGIHDQGLDEAGEGKGEKEKGGAEYWAV